MSENIRLTSSAEQSQPLSQTLTPEIPAPLTPLNLTGQSQMNEAITSQAGDKEAREEYLSVEASNNLGNWNRDNKSETSGIGGTK